jgi:hypothetical protein
MQQKDDCEWSKCDFGFVDGAIQLLFWKKLKKTMKNKGQDS